MKNLIGLIVLIGFLAAIPFASAEYWEERKELKEFLSEDKTNRMEKRGVSAHYVYLLAKNASQQNISLGMAFIYNSELDSGWYYAYYITEERHFIFIDSLTDATLNYTEATRQLGIDSERGEVTYKCYYPYFSVRGAGEPPNWAVRSLEKYHTEDVVVETPTPTCTPVATPVSAIAETPVIEQVVVSDPVTITVGQEAQEPEEPTEEKPNLDIVALLAFLTLLVVGFFIKLQDK